MRALVLYESMFGNTRTIAEAVAAGLGSVLPTDVVRVGEVTTGQVEAAAFLVVGGPTHAWGLSRASTRNTAAGQAAEPERALRLEPGATGTGLREWLESPRAIPQTVAVFDTRVDLPTVVTGRASAKAARALRRRGCRVVDVPTSFLVTKTNQLLPGEEERARAWGAHLASTFAVAGSRSQQAGGS